MIPKNISCKNNYFISIKKLFSYEGDKMADIDFIDNYIRD